MKRYILDENGNPVEEPDLFTWGKWMEKTDQRVVAQTDLPNGFFVSTVFLGLDHSFIESGEPVLFETMVFDRREGIDAPWADAYCNRYSTRQEAWDGHLATVARWEKKDGTEDEPEGEEE